MDQPNDIKEMISQAFHEIYDEPLDIEALNALFEPERNNSFQLSNLDYSSAEITNYIEQFLGCLKHSFMCPVTHHSEFDSYCHITKADEAKSKKHEESAWYPCNTPLVEINNLFQKFAFVFNLYKINSEFVANETEDEELGQKRKRKNKCRYKAAFLI